MSIFDGQAKLWDMVDGTEILTLADRNIPLDGVDFSPDGRYVTTSGSDGTISVYIESVLVYVLFPICRVIRTTLTTEPGSVPGQ